MILFELLTGERPFRGDVAMLLRQVVEDEAPSVRRLNGKINRDLETICAKCLEKPPARRYSTAAELSDDLRHFVAGEPIHARPVSRPERAWRWCNRQPVIASLSGASVLLLMMVAIIATIGYVWTSKALLGEKVARHDAEESLKNESAALREAETQRRKAKEEEDVAEHNLYFSQIALADQKRTLLDVCAAERILDACADRFRCWEWRYLKRFCHLHLLTLRGHKGPVFGVAFSPDGKRLATASSDHTAKIWDADNGQELLTLRGHEGPVFSVAFSPDGKRLATASNDKTAKIWDAASGKELLAIRAHSSCVRSVAFSPDGKRLATASFDKTAKIWDAVSGKELLALCGHTREVFCAAFSPDGKRLATASNDATAKIWDAASGKELLTLFGGAFAVESVAFSPDGKRLAMASGSEPTIWDAASGQGLLMLCGYSDIVHSVAFSPDGTRLATASEDMSAKIWDAQPPTSGLEPQNPADPRGAPRLAGSQLYYRLPPVPAPPGIYQLGPSSAGTPGILQPAASGSEVQTPPAGLVVGSGKPQPPPDGPPSGPAGSYTGPYNPPAGIPPPNWPQSGPAGAPGISQLPPPASRVDYYDVRGAAGTPGIIQLPPTAGPPLTLCRHVGPVAHLAFSPDGNWLATASYDNTVIIWDAADSRGGLTFRVDLTVFSPDGKRLATGGHMVKIWDVASGQELLTLPGLAFSAAPAPPEPCLGASVRLSELAFSPDGKRLVTASDDHTARIWDAATGQELLTLRGHGGVTFSPDGKRLATASDDHTAKIWDAATGHDVFTLRGHGECVRWVTFSPDGKRLATASGDKTAKIWDVATGRELLTLRGHTNAVNSVAFSADGKRLATTSSDEPVNHDNQVKIWDVASGQELFTLRGHKRSVNGVVFSPDGKLLGHGKLGQDGEDMGRRHRPGVAHTPWAYKCRQ